MSINVFIKFFLITFSFLISFAELNAQSRLIIRHPRPFDSEKDPALEETLKKALEKNLSGQYSIEFTEKEESEYPAAPDNYAFINIFYTREKNFPPNIYAQIYSSKTGEIIDAVSVSTKYDLIKEIEAELDKTEFNIPDSERAAEFSRKLEITLKLNPARKKQDENIIEHLTKEKIGKSPEFQKQNSISLIQKEPPSFLENWKLP